MTQQQPLINLDDVILSARAPRRPGAPLLDFTGKLVALEPGFIPNGNGRQQITFKFTGLKVEKSETPYAFPQIELNIPYQGQLWDALGESIQRIIGSPLRASEALGKTYHMAWTKGHKGRRVTPDTANLPRGQQTWEEASDLEAWEVLAIDGKTAPRQESSNGAAPNLESYDAFLAYLASLADGKTAMQLNQAAFVDSNINTKPALFQLLINGSEAVYVEMVTKGLISVDANGVYHKA